MGSTFAARRAGSRAVESETREQQREHAEESAELRDHPLMREGGLLPHDYAELPAKEQA